VDHPDPHHHLLLLWRRQLGRLRLRLRERLRLQQRLLLKKAPAIGRSK